MSKAIIYTHIRPHLDEICAIWLLKKFHPSFKDAHVRYVPGNPTGQRELRERLENKSTVFVGIGRGKFDEHKSTREECAASLVWKYLKHSGYQPKIGSSIKAVDFLVAYVLEDDLGKTMLLPEEVRDVSPTAIVEAWRLLYPNYQILSFGERLLDGLAEHFRMKHLLPELWKKRRVIKGTLGLGYGFEGDAKSGIDAYAYGNGADFVVIVDPKRGYRQYRSRADSDVDFSKLHQAVGRREPASRWFLHQSKRLLLSGADMAENRNLSRLSLDEMIELIHKTYD